jgi:hypothetical protein
VAGDASLEVGLRWDRAQDALWVSLRFNASGTALDDWLQPGTPIKLDFPTLQRLVADPTAYGQALFSMLFRQDDVGPFYRNAVARSQENDLTLHLRLHISGPARYNAVRWETLRDPHTELPLATDARIVMSRYLSSLDWRAVPAREKRELRALIVVAGPTNLVTHRPNGRVLSDVDVDREESLARSALAEVAYVGSLVGAEASLERLLDEVEDGIDVLYLVCHGAVVDDIPILYLENPDRTAQRVDGRRLSQSLVMLEHRPSIVMLSSCQSAGRGDEIWTGDDGELSALGPELAAAGVASVIAMQGDVSVASAQAFSQTFFSENERHGVVDRAMAAARRTIESRPDWWTPVLYSRLRSGRPYYNPEFTERADVTWENLRSQLATRNVLPVLGPGLADSILGSRQDIARRWVERWQMPLMPHTRTDLAQVAQYLRVQNDIGMVRAQLLEHLEKEVQRRVSRAAEGDPFYDLPDNLASADDVIREVGKRQRQLDDRNIYSSLAQLDVNIYVTTAWTDLLQDALREAGREPTTRAFAWNELNDPDALAGYETPTVDKPLVYHLFGRLDNNERRTIVLTEDDYFGWYSAWLIRRNHEVPPDVRRALVQRSLLFLGFQLDQWDFRVVFHSIKSFEGSGLMKENRHVGVQLSPDNQLIDPEAAQEYLESYFGTDNVNIFWGKAKDFLAELLSRMR